MNIKKLIKYIKKNPTKILENLTSYLTIISAIGEYIIFELTGLGLSVETLIIIISTFAFFNRILTFIRVTLLKNKIEKLNIEKESV